jgi:alkaline phosphatase D
LTRHPRGLVAATVVLATLFGASEARAAGFSSGVAAGEVAAHSVKLWTRAPATGRVTVMLGRKRGHMRLVARARARSSHDRTLTVRLRHLEAGSTYRYRFCQGRRRSAVGRFRTAPAPGANARVRFAWSGDADAQPLEPGGPPFWNAFGVYARMAKEHNAFNVNLGDTIYSDTEVGATNTDGRFVTASPPALSRAAKWAKYRMNLGLPALRRLRAAAGLYSHWDDHEFINDFTRAEDGGRVFRAGMHAFRDYAPVTWSSRNGLYRSFRWGRNLEVFFLDERSFRDAKASAGGDCDNPQTGAPDLAPTAPAASRAVFAALVPSFSSPVSAACLAAIDDPGRSMLGRRQYDRFTRAVGRSRAVWKVIVNEVPIQQFYALPYDRWEGYAAERAKLLEFLRDHVRNVVFLTTDVHGSFVNDARLRTLEPGGPLDSGILDITTGPVATRSFSLEIDAATGSSGSGDLITQAFFKPAPPDGVGMTCAASDTFSYGQVDVTARRLEVRLKDAQGDPVIDAGTGAPCAPVVLRSGG